MKKFLAVFMLVMMIATNVYAISWTKLWSAADDGSPYSGSDIGIMQNDINTQAVTLTGNQTITGNNIFSGTTTFSGTIVGITGSSAHNITRGFELVWKSTTVVTVNAGTLYHGTTQVNKTANVDLDITLAADAIDGATAQQATSCWRYVYCDASGNLKLWSVAPDKSDTAGNTAGTKYYYYYAATTTYYRCLGAIRLNATGSGEIDKFFQQGNYIAWDIPVAITTVLSAGAWSGAISCAAAMPVISNYAMFGFYGESNAAGYTSACLIRSNGSTFSTSPQNGVSLRHSAGGANQGGGLLFSFVDSSQQINHQEAASTESAAINLLSYYINIR